MKLLFEILKNGMKYTFLFILFVILSIIFSILFMFGFAYYIKLWEIIPNDLHFLLLILLPIIIIVGIITTIIKKIFGSDNSEEKPKQRQPIDVLELARTIRKEIDDEKLNK